MRRFILAATAIAALAVPALASASINDSGVGHVDKGTVQDTLGFNDAQLQTAWNNGQIHFTTRVTAHYQLTVTCSGEIDFYLHRLSVDVPLNATALKNKQGKVTQGWDFNGRGAIPLPPVPDSCNNGNPVLGTEVVLSDISATMGLQVNGIALP